jgi:hypothetical protein
MGVVHGVCLVEVRADTTPSSDQEPQLALTLHFAMKFSRRSRANRAKRVSTQGRIFGLRICDTLSGIASVPPSPTGCRLAFGRVFSTRWNLVMRYRSATVADFHGLPRIPGRAKERRTRRLQSPSHTEATRFEKVRGARRSPAYLRKGSAGRGPHGRD